MKKMFVLLLAVLRCVGLAAGASAATVNGNYSTGVEWTYDDTTKTLTISGSGKISNNDQPWISYASDIESLVIEEGVTSIGNYAFYDCTGLTSVSIPNSVTAIGNYAFCGCSNLTTVTIEGSIDSIGNSAFYGCANLISFEYRGTKGPKAGKYVFIGCGGVTIFVPEDYEDDKFAGMDVTRQSDTGGEEEPTTYTVTVTTDPAEGGMVTADKATVAAGETVTLTVNPASGYKLDTLTVKQGETEVTVTNNTFTMPTGNVIVTATFSQIHVCADHLTPIEANAATCIENGNSEYYTCSCGKYYQDEEAQTEIEKDSWVILDPNAHDWNEPTYTQQGEKHVAHYVCKHDNEHTKQDDPADHVYSAPDYTCVCKKVQQFTITFNTDGGSTVVPITQDYNTIVIAPQDPTKDGYAFVGWADEAGNIVTFPMNMPLDGMKLEAVWQLIPVADLPKTGDTSQLGLWMTLMSLTGAALLLRRRREN